MDNVAFFREIQLYYLKSIIRNAIISSEVINMKLASIFTDRLVLQKGLPVKVFGQGSGTVMVSFLDEAVTQSFDGFTVKVKIEKSYI